MLAILSLGYLDALGLLFGILFERWLAVKLKKALLFSLNGWLSSIGRWHLMLLISFCRSFSWRLQLVTLNVEVTFWSLDSIFSFCCIIDLWSRSLFSKLRDLLLESCRCNLSLKNSALGDTLEKPLRLRSSVEVSLSELGSTYGMSPCF